MWFPVWVPVIPCSRSEPECESNSTCVLVDAFPDNEDEVPAMSCRVMVSSAMKTMVQSVSNCEGKVELVSCYGDVKPWKRLEPAVRAKLKRISKKTRTLRDCGKLEGAAGSTCESPSLCFGIDDRVAESSDLHLAAVSVTNSGHIREASLLPEEALPESIPSISNSEYHVLVVDDSNFDRRVVERFLKASSYKVTTVNSALVALEYLGLSDSCSPTVLEPNKVAVDLIITDYCMPGMTGYELLKIVKADTSVCKEISVIVMSSEGYSDRINRCLAEGAGDYLVKPVKMDDVRRLRGHIRSSVSSFDPNDSSNSSIGAKRKSPDGVHLHSPERRPKTAE